MNATNNTTAEPIDWIVLGETLHTTGIYKHEDGRTGLEVEVYCKGNGRWCWTLWRWRFGLNRFGHPAWLRDEEVACGFGHDGAASARRAGEAAFAIA